MWERWHKIEKVIGGLKFAIILISLFALSLAVGTILESLYGTEFANRLLYKSLPFMGLQFLLFLSIFFATLLRLPPQKRLYGFYTLHAGLLTIFCGSFLTYYSGIDGTLTLLPQTPTRTVTLPDDLLTITHHREQKEISLALPFNAGPTTIDRGWEGIHVQSFLPFSENKLSWQTFSADSKDQSTQHSSRYHLFNDRVSQEFTLSLHPEALDFESSAQMGPLSVHYLPQNLLACFSRENPSNLILWHTSTQTCFLPHERNIEIKTTAHDKRFFVLKESSQDKTFYTFFPDLSPWPLESLDGPLKWNQSSPYRVLSRQLFQEKPHLFLFGPGLSYFDGEKWQVSTLVPGQLAALPWMDFKLQMQEHHTDRFPQLIPEYARPIHEDGKIVVGEQKALEVIVQGKSFWVKSDTPLGLQILGDKYTLELKKKTLRLPYELTLTNFKMDTDPGTQNPASYESFVQLFSSTGPQKEHIYMNNPLKYESFTFYQASYFQTENGYGSVLSVNYDPGRPVKYFGCLLLVFGCLWHFVFNRIKNKKSSPRRTVAKTKGISPLVPQEN